MTKKLKDFHQAGVDALNEVQGKLKQHLAELQSDQQPDPLEPSVYASILLAEERKKEWLKLLDGIVANIDGLRSSMANESNSAADIENLAEQLRVLQIKQKATLSLISDESDLISELQRNATFITLQLEIVAADLSAEQQALDEATEREERNSSWTDDIDKVLADDPEASVELSWLKTIKADANTVLNDVLDVFKQAQDRVNADIPEEVRTRALERTDNVLALEVDSVDALSSLDDKFNEKNKADDGISGAIVEKSTQFEDEQNVLAEFITNAKQSYDIAIALLQAIVDSEVMSDSQQQRVTALVTAALAVTPEEDIVFNKEQTRNEKQRQVDQKQQELLAAEAIVRTDDPDISDEDLANHATVQPIRDELGDETTGLIKELLDASAALGFEVFAELSDLEILLDQAILEFEQAKVEFLKENPGADPELDLDSSIADPRTERDNQQVEVDAKLIEFKDTNWYQLEEMEISIPDRIWNNFKQLHGAENRLEQLNSLPDDLAVFKTNLEIAEDELVTALEEERSSERGFEVLIAEIEQLSARVRWLAEQRESRLFDAARGVD